MANKQIRNGKRKTAINIPINEEEYQIFTSVIRDYYHETFSNFIRQMIIKEYHRLVDNKKMERIN